MCQLDIKLASTTTKWEVWCGLRDSIQRKSFPKSIHNWALYIMSLYINRYSLQKGASLTKNDRSEKSIYINKYFESMTIYQKTIGSLYGLWSSQSQAFKQIHSIRYWNPSYGTDLISNQKAVGYLHKCYATIASVGTSCQHISCIAYRVQC